MQATALAKTLGATALTVQGGCGMNTSLMQHVHDELQQVEAHGLRPVRHSHAVLAWVSNVRALKPVG